MNTLEKGKKYADNYIGYKLTVDHIAEAYIQGSKDMYIEKEHEKIYDAVTYLPPKAIFNCRTIEVIDFDSTEMVYYDYDQKAWLTSLGDFTSVERWKFAEPEKVEPEKSAHQLAEELKQAQFEIEEMKNVVKQLNAFRFEANEQVQQLVETFEELLTDQFTLCELRDVWRKRAGLTQKCEE